jgi:hypothetical protein
MRGSREISSVHACDAGVWFRSLQGTLSREARLSLSRARSRVGFAVKSVIRELHILFSRRAPARVGWPYRASTRYDGGDQLV